MDKKFGVRWGYAGGTTLTSVEAVKDAARFAAEAGFDSLWVSQASGVDPIVALSCLDLTTSPLQEVGTSVVPLFGRHPLPLAQQALTAQSALDGRFTLGVGAASRAVAEEKMGLNWDRPYSFTAEFLAGLQPLLAGKAADVAGDQVTTKATLDVPARRTPVLLAGLGPRMLKLAGTHTDGTTLGQCGPRTIREFVAPTIQEAAADAGCPSPRIMALVRISVTDEIQAAYTLAKQISARYQAFPSYAKVLAREALDDPADIHLIGSWQRILDGLADYAEAGVTDLRIEVACHTERATQDTRAALAAHLV